MSRLSQKTILYSKHASDLGLMSFRVTGLFDAFDHEIAFPVQGPDADAPQVVFLVGPNGVGKTTLLKMLAGILELDFTPCRAVPFETAELVLSTGDTLRVKRTVGGELAVEFRDHLAILHAAHPGPALTEQTTKVDALSAEALPLLGQMSFRLVNVDRGAQQRELDAEHDGGGHHRYYSSTGEFISERKHRRRRVPMLADRVSTFVRDAQINYRDFFATNSPELLPRLVARISEKSDRSVSREDLRARIATVLAGEQDMKRLGLVVDTKEIEGLGHLVELQNEFSSEIAAVFDWYVEVIESRYEQRQLIATRLLNFERIVSDFWSGKSLTCAGSA